MRYSKLTMLIPCALLLSACTTVTPAYKDNGTRSVDLPYISRHLLSLNPLQARCRRYSRGER